jgi:hypothetical protein
MEQLEESDILFAKVLLIGGFSESQALKGCIQSWLNENDLAVPVISAGMSAGIIVAKGAVLRALNKDHGPSRFVRSSFGLLRHIPAIKGAEPSEEERELFTRKPEPGRDGSRYFMDCIEWFIHEVWQCMFPIDWLANLEG